MNVFKECDVVRFKGDDTEYKVTFVNYASGTYDVTTPGDPREPTVQFVPGRLLEKAPEKVRPGQVWRGSDPEEGEYRLFVMRADTQDSILYTTTWDTEVCRGSADYIRNYHELELDSSHPSGWSPYAGG